MCVTVWVEHVVMCKESQPSVIEYLLVDTRRSAHKIFHILASLFPPEHVERFSKSASISSVTSSRTVVPLYGKSQSGLKVPWDKHAIETPKVPSSRFNLTFFRSLPLVPIKRVLGVPLANQINELMAQPKSDNNQ
jgi:hypothetical protein